MTYIYALTDACGVIRYIGKTKNLRSRLSGHISESRSTGGVNRKCRWLQSLFNRGERPQLIILEECEDDGCDRERYHIALALADGLDLTNLTDGGDEPEYTPEARQRMSETRRRKIETDPAFRLELEESARRMGLAGRGVPKPESMRKKLSTFRKGKPKHPNFIAGAVAYHTGRKQTPEEIEKRIAPLRGRTLDPEMCARRGLKMRGKKQPPEAVEKTAAAKRGTHHREDTKQQISYSMRKRLCGALADNPDVPQIVMAHRIAKGLSQEQLAALIEVDDITVYRIEHGIKTPSIKTARRIDRVLGTKFVT